MKDPTQSEPDNIVTFPSGKMPASLQEAYLKDPTVNVLVKTGAPLADIVLTLSREKANLGKALVDAQLTQLHRPI